MVMVPVCLNGRCCSSVCVGVVSCKPRWRRWVSVSSNFSKTCSHGRLPSSHVGIRNIPSNVSYDDTKHYQVQSEHRRTQNPFKHLRWTVFAKTVNTLKSLLDTQKSSVLDVWRGSEYASAAKLGRCKVCNKNSRRRYVKYKSTWCVLKYFNDNS